MQNFVRGYSTIATLVVYGCAYILLNGSLLREADKCSDSCDCKFGPFGPFFIFILGGGGGQLRRMLFFILQFCVNSFCLLYLLISLNVDFCCFSFFVILFFSIFHNLGHFLDYRHKFVGLKKFDGIIWKLDYFHIFSIF